MRVRPFSFLEEVDDAVAFPTLSGTVSDYWLVSNGITLSGGDVSTWDGVLGNKTFLASTEKGGWISSSNADFNNEDTITFDGNRGIGYIDTNIGGTDTGEVCMALYGAPHPSAGGWGTIHGLTGLGGSPYNFVEAVERGVNLTEHYLYKYPSGASINSSDLTYGKGLYTLSSSSGTGAEFYNKGTTINASSTYTNYYTTRQQFSIAAYNPINSASLMGIVDVAGYCIWVNPTNIAADITALDTYFSSIYG